MNNIAPSTIPTWKFASHWLYHSIINKNLTGDQIQECFVEMSNWLEENEITMFKWSSEYAVGDKRANIPSMLFFEHQIDLLAFNLRFGI